MDALIFVVCVSIRGFSEWHGRYWSICAGIGYFSVFRPEPGIFHRGFAAANRVSVRVAGLAEPGEMQTKTRCGFPGLSEPGYRSRPAVLWLCPVVAPRQDQFWSGAEPVQPLQIGARHAKVHSVDTMTGVHALEFNPVSILLFAASTKVRPCRSLGAN